MSTNYPWLSTLPPHWNRANLGHIAAVGTGSADVQDSTEVGEFPFFVRSDQILRLNTYTHDTEAVLTAGDGRVGEIFHHVNGKFAAHQRVYVIEPGRFLTGRYLLYAMKAHFGPSLAGTTAKSTVESLRRPMLTSFQLALPPLEEQKLIADYLDRETAEIDAFVADLENLKTLTTERVLALLEHELWGNADEVAPLRRFLLGVDQGVSPEADSSPAGPGEVGVLKAGCTNNGRFDVWANKRLDSSDQFTASMFVAEGDLIVTRASGSLRHVGSAALVPCLDRKLAMSDKHYRLITDSRLEGEYLALVMQTNRWRIQLEPLVSGAQGLARNISVANLKTLEIPVVSRAKQEEIKENLREQIQKVGMASEDIDALISLGEEHRAALISAAVTGKINVTEQGASAAEQLRDELGVHV